MKAIFLYNLIATFSSIVALADTAIATTENPRRGIGFIECRPVSTETLYKRSDVILQARIIEKDLKEILISPLKIWKGKQQPIPHKVIWSIDPTYKQRSMYRKGKDYIFFLNRAEENNLEIYKIDMCQPPIDVSQELSNSSSDYDRLKYLSRQKSLVVE